LFALGPRLRGDDVEGEAPSALLSKEIAQTRNGGRHCCQPPLRRAKDLPVFAGRFGRSLPTSSILAQQLRRRVRSWFSPKTDPRRFAALLGSTLFSRFPLPCGVGSCDRKIDSSGASCRLVQCVFDPPTSRRVSASRPRTIACRRRSDLWSLVAFGPVALPAGGPGPLPRSPSEYALADESLKAESLG